MNIAGVRFANAVPVVTQASDKKATTPHPKQKAISDETLAGMISRGFNPNSKRVGRR